MHRSTTVSTGLGRPVSAGVLVLRSARVPALCMRTPAALLCAASIVVSCYADPVFAGNFVHRAVAAGPTRRSISAFTCARQICGAARPETVVVGSLFPRHS